MVNKSVISINMLNRHLLKNISPFLLLVLFFSDIITTLPYSIIMTAFTVF